MNSNKKRISKLTLRFIFHVALIAFVVLIIFSAVELSVEYGRVEKRVNAAIQALQRRLERSTVRPIYEYSFHTLQQTLESEFFIDFLIAIKVHEPDYSRGLLSVYREQSDFVLENSEFEADDFDQHTFVVYYTEPDFPIAVIELYFSRDVLIEEMMAQVLTDTLRIIVYLLCIIFIIAMLFGKMVVFPLTYHQELIQQARLGFADTARAVHDQVLSLPKTKFLPPYRELSEMYQSFVNLLQELDNSQQSLLDRERSLSLKVVENERLLKEVHHRVKNNLMFMSSLLSLYKRENSCEDTQAFIQNINSKQQTMAAVYKNLYDEDHVEHLDFGACVTSIIQVLSDVYYKEVKGISIEHRVVPVKLNIDTAIPLSIALNEILLNSILHAFSDTADKKIDVKLYSKEKKLYLEAGDNGCGFDFNTHSSLGVTIIKLLTQQVSAEILYEKNNGSRYTIVMQQKISRV